MNRHSTNSESRPSRLPWFIAGLVVVSLSAWMLLSGNDVRLSETGYELSKALYAACNLEDATRLQAIKNHPELATLSPQELALITAIIDRAEQGQWTVAQRDARALLQSQNSP